MTTVSQINSAIISGSFTNDDLNAISDAIRFARSQIAQKNKFTLVKGTKVKFTSSKTGVTHSGEVTDVKRKFIHVKVGLTTWRVPASMLSAA